MAEVGEGSVVDGRYRVLSRLGAGGMADVWLAEDAHLQRRVALKVLHRRFAQDREFVERFRREAESAAGLQHPHVVAVYDRGEFEGTYYIAMQYVEGPTLKQLIDRGISIEQAVALIRQVLEAARFAHRNGIVHRDLKPQNVIVDPDGKAVVTDFGIARAGVSEITQTGSVMGTPHYLSPEGAQGHDVTAVSVSSSARRTVAVYCACASFSDACAMLTRSRTRPRSSSGTLTDGPKSTRDIPASVSEATRVDV